MFGLGKDPVCKECGSMYGGKEGGGREKSRGGTHPNTPWKKHLNSIPPPSDRGIFNKSSLKKKKDSRIKGGKKYCSSIITQILV